MFALGIHASTAYLAGQLIGAFMLPMIAVGVASVWDGNRTQRTLVKVFFFTCVALTTLTVLSMASVRGYWKTLANGGRILTPSEVREQAVACMRSRDLACAEDRWSEYVHLRPLDGRGMANLGMVMNMRDEHAQAVTQFQRSIEAGEGTYDLFAYYADSLAKLGRVDEAIDWYYRALSITPTLVDVRGSLATLLVSQHRPHEALALLQAFDADAERHGRTPYFSGQRIAIEGALNKSVEAQSTLAPLRLPTYQGHYFVPVTLGTARAAPFMVDTGATVTTFSKALLDASKADYRVVNGSVQMTTADGRRVPAQAVLLNSMRLGPFDLKDVPAVICSDCMSLLGQSTLTRFDLQSARVQGVEFLTLLRRAGS